MLEPTVPTIEMGDCCRGTVPGPHLTVPEELAWAASAAQDISHPGAGAYAMGWGGTVAQRVESMVMR